MGHGAETSLTHVRYPCRDPDEVYDDVEPTYHSGPGPRSRGDRVGHSARQSAEASEEGEQSSQGPFLSVLLVPGPMTTHMPEGLKQS